MLPQFASFSVSHHFGDFCSSCSLSVCQKSSSPCISESQKASLPESQFPAPPSFWCCGIERTSHPNHANLPTTFAHPAKFATRAADTDAAAPRAVCVHSGAKFGAAPQVSPFVGCAAHHVVRGLLHRRSSRIASHSNKITSAATRSAAPRARVTPPHAAPPATSLVSELLNSPALTIPFFLSNQENTNALTVVDYQLPPLQS